MTRRISRNKKSYNTYGIIVKKTNSYKKDYTDFTIIYLNEMNIPIRVKHTLPCDISNHYQVENFISLLVKCDDISIISVVQSDMVPYEQLDILDGFLGSNNNSDNKEPLINKVQRHRMQLLVCAHCGGPLKQDSFECPYCGYITE